MIILVSDTSVLIDLERGRLLPACFRLPWKLAVPDLLYLRELAAYNGPALVSQGLLVESLHPSEISAAQAIGARYPKLSVADAFAFSLAQGRDWPLLTGDGALRGAAHAAGLSSNGVLWVCDELFSAGALLPDALCDGLTAIGSHPRCRLPRAEIEVRLGRYRSR